MSQLPMNHFDDEQLVDAYYGEFDPAPHFAACEECRGRFERLRDFSIRSIKFQFRSVTPPIALRCGLASCRNFP